MIEPRDVKPDEPCGRCGEPFSEHVRVSDCGILITLATVYVCPTALFAMRRKQAVTDVTPEPEA